MRYDQEHHSCCPECGETGDNLSSNGASGRGGMLVDGKNVVVEDTPGDLTGFHYHCKKCDTWFTSKSPLPTDNYICYAMDNSQVEGYLKSLKDKKE